MLLDTRAIGKWQIAEPPPKPTAKATSPWIYFLAGAATGVAIGGGGALAFYLLGKFL